MFAKGSRYRNVTVSSAVNAQGEHAVGTDVRAIEPAPGRFEHTVRDRDRLDLLAYKYYADATRWWQIGDANPAFDFPNDLLDRAPLEDAVFLIAHPDAAARYAALLTALASLGSVAAPSIGLPGDFVSASLVVVYAAAAARAQILAAIGAQAFHLLRSFAWPVGTDTAEQFTIEDAALKTSWHDMIRALEAAPGVVRILSDMATSSIGITVNTTGLDLAGVRQTIRQYGFDTPASQVQVSDRTGARIVIPPNGTA